MKTSNKKSNIAKSNVTIKLSNNSKKAFSNNAKKTDAKKTDEVKTSQWKSSTYEMIESKSLSDQKEILAFFKSQNDEVKNRITERKIDLKNIVKLYYFKQKVYLRTNLKKVDRLVSRFMLTFKDNTETLMSFRHKQ